MERAGSILDKQRKSLLRSSDSENQSTSNPTPFVLSNDQAVSHMSPPELVPCEYCGALRFTRGIIVGNKLLWNPAGPEPCACAEGVSAYELAESERKAKLEADAKAEAARRFAQRSQKIIGDLPPKTGPNLMLGKTGFRSGE